MIDRAETDLAEWLPEWRAVDVPLWVRLITHLADGSSMSKVSCQQAVGRIDWADAGILDELRRHGVAIGEEHVRLPGGVRLLAAQRVRQEVSPAVNQWLQRLETLPSVTSTNELLMAAGRRGPIDGCVLVAEHQQQGRGRRGRQWHSPFACNVYMSVGMHCPRAELLQGYSLAVGVAVADALAVLGAAGLSVKWPNDLQHVGKKLGGILIESSGIPEAGFDLVIGIGLNVLLPPSAESLIDQPFTDLASLGIASVSRERIVAEILTHLLSVHELLLAEGLGAVLPRFAAVDALAGHEVRATVDGKPVVGRAVGVSPTGELRITTASGERLVGGGEVSVRRT